MVGPDVSHGKRRSTPVTPVDVYPTILESMCGQLDANEKSPLGSNLIDNSRDRPDGRVAFSELHDDRSMTGEFMLRADNRKLIH